MDTSKTGPRKPDSALEQCDVQAELARTRVLLRSVLESLLDSGHVFVRDGPMSQWWQEEMRRPKVDA